MGGGLLWVADRSSSGGTVEADGRWDHAFFQGFRPFDAEARARKGDFSSSIVLRGLWARSTVAVDVALSTAARRPHGILIYANDVAVGSGRAGGRMDVVSFVGTTDTSGVLRVRVTGLDPDEPSDVHVAWVRAVQSGRGSVPWSRLGLYGLFLVVWGALATWASGVARVSPTAPTQVSTVSTVPPPSGAPGVGVGLVGFGAAVLALACAVVSPVRLHVLALLPWLLALLAATLAVALVTLVLRMPRSWARWVALGFCLRLAFALHPAFPGGDAMFQAHNVMRYRQGRILSSAAPGLEGRDAVTVPYPPALYAALSPVFAARPRQEGPSIIRLVIGLLEGTAPLLVFALMRAGGACADAAGAGAAFCAVMPEAVLVLAKGIAAQVAGAWAGLWAILALVWRRWPVASIVLLALVFLTHFGSALSLGFLLPAWWALAWRRGELTGRQVVVLAGIVCAAAALAFLLYYRDVLSLTLSGMGALGGDAAGTPSRFFHFRWVRLGKVLQDLLLKFGGLPVVIAAFGMTRSPELGTLRTPLQAWFGAGAVLGLLALLTPVPVRFEYFVVPAVAVAAGLGAIELLRRGRGRLVTLALASAFGVQLGVGVLLWLDRFELISVIIESPRWPFPVR